MALTGRSEPAWYRFMQDFLQCGYMHDSKRRLELDLPFRPGKIYPAPEIRIYRLVAEYAGLDVDDWEETPDDSYIVL